VKLPDLAAGTYGVVWRSAEDDGHTTRGVSCPPSGAAAPAGLIIASWAPMRPALAATPVGVLPRWLGLCSSRSGRRPAVAGPCPAGPRRRRRRRGCVRDPARVAQALAVAGRQRGIRCRGGHSRPRRRWPAGVGGRGGSLAHAGLDLLTSTRWGHPGWPGRRP
jgi:hypothetical protein